MLTLKYRRQDYVNKYRIYINTKGKRYINKNIYIYTHIHIYRLVNYLTINRD